MTTIARPSVERTLRSTGRTLRVSVSPGDRSKVPLLLMNGIGAPLELLQPFVDALDTEREIIRFDVPGIGGSQLPIVPYTMGTLSLAVAGLLDQLGYAKPLDVMGFSWGGALAQHFAIQHRSRCRRLVLAATGMGSVMVPASPRVLLRMATPRRHRDPYYAQQVAADLYGGTMRDDPEVASRLLHGEAKRGPQRGYYYQLAAAAGWSSIGWLPMIKQRTLIMCGNDDPLVPAINAKIMSTLIPRSRLHLYDGGHLALLSEANDLAPVVEQFLDYRTSTRPVV